MYRYKWLLYLPSFELGSTDKELANEIQNVKMTQIPIFNRNRSTFQSKQIQNKLQQDTNSGLQPHSIGTLYGINLTCFNFFFLIKFFFLFTCWFYLLCYWLFFSLIMILVLISILIRVYLSSFVTSGAMHIHTYFLRQISHEGQ